MTDINSNPNLVGTANNDTLLGTNKKDIISGAAGADLLAGRSGKDLLLGGAGNDALLGGADSDLLLGGDDDDTLLGDSDFQLFGLTDRNTLVVFSPDQPSRTTQISVSGIEGKLLGIDVRPADGLLYGVTDANKVYRIDPNTGAATFVSTLSAPFKAGQQSGVDFNPVPDRLRLVGTNDQNLRFNIDTGALADFDPNTPGVQPDLNLAYAQGDPNFGVDPNITAAAYLNAFPGPPSPTGVTPPTRTTQLFGIDAKQDVLVLQDPPNNGTLRTIGSLGVDFGATGGFDVYSPTNGVNIAYAASGSTLYTIDLSTGAAKPIGKIGNGSVNLVGLAAVTLTNPAAKGNDVLLGGGGNDMLNGNAGDDLLVGGAGSDIFSFSSTRSFSGDRLGIDIVTDFVRGTDKIALDRSTFNVLTSAVGSGFSVASEFAAVTDDKAVAGSAALIVYSTATGKLFYNQNGSAAGLGTGAQFATVADAAIAAADFQITA